MDSVLSIMLLLLLLLFNIVYIMYGFIGGIIFPILFIVVGFVLINYVYIVHVNKHLKIGILGYLSAIYIGYGIIAYFDLPGYLLNIVSISVLLFIISYYWDVEVAKKIVSPSQPIALFMSIFIAVIIGCRDPLWYASLPLIEIFLYMVDTGGRSSGNKYLGSLLLQSVYSFVLYTFPYTYTSIVFVLASLSMFMIKINGVFRKYIGKIIGVDIILRPLLSVINI